MILAIGIMNYLYKFTMAIILTPVIMLVEKRIEKYVGKETAMKMKRAAMGQKEESEMMNIPAAGWSEFFFHQLCNHFIYRKGYTLVRKFLPIN